MNLQIEQILPLFGGKLDFNQLILLLFLLWVFKQVPVWVKGLYSVFEIRKLQTETLLQLSQNVNSGTELIVRHFAEISKDIQEIKMELMKVGELHKEEILDKLEKLDKNIKNLLKKD